MNSRGLGAFRRFRSGAAALALALGAFGATGCTAPLAGARANFELGRLDAAEASLRPEKAQRKDRVLVLMERGTVRQAKGDYAGSSRDFIEAADLVEELAAYSVSKGVASFVANDTTQDFRGAPYERTLLHTMTALNHLALGDWESAAIESRRIIQTLDPEALGGYPECAFSRYVAGFGLEMMNDPSNAALQYRLAAALAPQAGLDERGGAAAGGGSELVVFVLLGRAPTGYDVASGQPPSGAPLFAEIEIGGRVVGQSRPLSDTLDLAFNTAQKQIALKVAKTVTRIVIKDAIAEAVAKATDEEFLGALTRFVLIGLLEQPDMRRWETLPRYLQVARVPCPSDLASFRVRVKAPGGYTLRADEVSAPLQRRGRVFVSLYRDYPPLSY